VAATAPAAATIAAPEDAVAAVADVAIIRRLLLLPGSCVLQIENKTINYLALKYKIHKKWEINEIIDDHTSCHNSEEPEY